MNSTTTPTPCLPSSTLSSTFANLLPPAPAPAPLPPPISSSLFLGSFSSLNSISISYHPPLCPCTIQIT
ncbi:hypothetical protein HMI56_003142 [Coelomomyces lativittatus]|nr:hypothetical protein HMI56_003142 [Coelomomyces lativittatus]